MLRKANYRPRTIFGLWSTVLVAGVIAAVAGKLLIGSPDFPDSYLLSGDRRRRCFGPRCPCHDSGSHSWGRLSCRVADRRGLSICSLSRAVGSFLMLFPVLGLRGRISGKIMKPKHLPVNVRLAPKADIRQGCKKGIDPADRITEVYTPFSQTTAQRNQPHDDATRRLLLRAASPCG